ncbi:PRTRC system ThiF family protein [Mongoliitalea daihaiensis]|uniref:PRTRC system ThiF family protein n=1 Tax=Mongoliitalea daihaiensis TaxID=2782006 RepID=UPI001F2CF1BA|nr:PRTRC system ThiF family protein [Mongoliitalea daihaiensis]UJP64047.1 PRTRC system ThiF family protein [Mongoliitalea daihaiensis]
MHTVKKYLLEDQHDITVVLIGAGGSGSFMLSNLARINYALIKMGRKGLYTIVMDPDTVSEFNVGRQLFSPSDVGRNKAEVLVERINRAYGTSWAHSSKKIDVNTKKIEGNIIITCVDNVKARKQVKKVFGQKIDEIYFKNHYWLDMGNDKDFGQVILSDLKELPDIFTLYPKLKDGKKDGPSCSMAESLNRQSLFINSTVTQFASVILFDLLTKAQIENHGVFLNLNSMQTKPMKCIPTKQS